MRPQYAALVALLLDSAVGVSFRRGAEDIFLEELVLEKRADSSSSTVIPAPINVEPSQYWDGNDGPWSSFEIQVGTPKQNVRVMISTAGFNTWTINEANGCPNGTIMGCEASRGQPFLTNESLTWIPNSAWTLGLEDNLGLDSSAYFGFDTVTLGWQGSGLPTAEHMVISNLGVDTYWLGTFGLNPQPTNFSNFNDPQPSFMTALRNNNTIPSLAWAYTAGNQYRFSGDQFGSLVLGGYDQSKFVATNLTIPFGSDVSRDLLIGVQSVTTNASTTSLSSVSGGFYAFIDSTLPFLWLPESMCQAFEAVFGLEWDSYQELYFINDTIHKKLLSQNPEVTFTLGVSDSGGETVDIVLPYAAFDLEISYPYKENKTRYFPLKQAANATQYTLGRTFLQEAYLIADYERRNFTVAPCNWTENAASDIRTILSPDTVVPGSGKSSGISGGAIAGIVIGVVAAIAIIGAAVWFFQRRKKQDQKKIAELEAKSAAVADSSSGSGSSENGGTAYSDNASKPVISQPIGGELASDSEIHEMQDHPHGLQEYYGAPKHLNADGSTSGGTGTGTGTGTWQSGLSEVEGNNEPIYEMMGSEVQELPDSRRQSWADGEDTLMSRPPLSQPTLPQYSAHDFPRDEKTGLH